MNIKNIDKLIASVSDESKPWNIRKYTSCFCGHKDMILGNNDTYINEFLDVNDLITLTAPYNFAYHPELYPRSRAINALKALKEGKVITPTWEGIES